MGCGFEPPAPPSLPVLTWQPPCGALGYQGEPPVICAGYTTRLPEVIEATRGHFHLTKGSLEVHMRGETITDLYEHAIETIAVEQSHVDYYRSTPMSKGGGGEG